MAKKSKDQISRERAERWQRYGTLGQARYGEAALDRIITDKTATASLITEALAVKKRYNNLIAEYKKHLQIKEPSNV